MADPLLDREQVQPLGPWGSAHTHGGRLIHEHGVDQTLVRARSYISWPHTILTEAKCEDVEGPLSCRSREQFDSQVTSLKLLHGPCLRIGPSTSFLALRRLRSVVTFVTPWQKSSSRYHSITVYLTTTIYSEIPSKTCWPSERWMDKFAS